MKRLFLLTVAIIILGSGIVFLYSCGGGGDTSTTYYADMDGDGFGDVNDPQILDSAQGGWVLDSTDCDDDPAYGYFINPAAPELCDDWIDNNCDDLVDCYDQVICGGSADCVKCDDSDMDGYLLVDLGCSGGNDCADADSTVNPGIDFDGDTIDACQDCDDFDSTTGTGTAEVCNDFDDDCDNVTDEEWYDGTVTYTDLDGTPGFVKDDSCGVGICAGGTVICSSNEVDLECSTEVNATTETCNGLDDDCDGQTDESDPANGTLCDGPDSDACNEGTLSCSSGSLVCSDNTGGNVEVCNGLDDDCDGETDEGLIDPCP